jgi:tetratricopeptide (TPR) repeat protein
MKAEFTALIQQLIAEQGREALLDAAKCRAMLADYSKGEYKKESRLLLQAIEAGISEALSKADDIASCKAQAVRKLEDEYYLAENIAQDVVEMLTSVLTTPQAREAAIEAAPKCAKCGAEVQSAWTICPYCGTAMNSELQAESSPQAETKPEQDIQPATVVVTPQSVSQSAPVSVPQHPANKKKIAAIAAGIVIVVAIVISLFVSNANLQQAQEYFSMGMSYANDKAYANAEIAFTEAIRLNTKNAVYYFERSKTYQEDDWVDKAIADLSKAIDIDPKNADALSRRVGLYRFKNDYDKALVDYNKLIQITQNDATANSQALINRAMLYHNMGEFDKCIEDATKVIERNPANYLAYYVRIHSYEGIDEYDKAINDYTYLINHDNDSKASNYNGRAFVYYYISKYQNALSDINAALAIEKDASYYDTRGTIYRAMDYYDNAIADYTEAIRLNSNNAFYYMNRSLAYWWKNNDAAKMDEDQAMAFRISKQGAARAWVETGINWANSGGYIDAVRAYNNALELDPNNQTALRRKAKAEDKIRSSP